MNRFIDYFFRKQLLAYSRIASLLFIENLIVVNLEEFFINYQNCDFNDFSKLFSYLVYLIFGGKKWELNTKILLKHLFLERK